MDLIMRIFICKTTDIAVYKLTDKELLNIKPTIDKNGNAILISIIMILRIVYYELFIVIGLM